MTTGDAAPLTVLVDQCNKRFWIPATQSVNRRPQLLEHSRERTPAHGPVDTLDG